MTTLLQRTLTRFQKLWNQHEQTARVLSVVFLVLVAASIRLWFISNGNVHFWFDQSRDATVATEIIANRDIKIQGPSASGTDDSVHHGVLYYYVIAPLYAIGGGDPVFVSGALGMLSLFAFAPVLVLTWSMTRSWSAVVFAGVLFAFSTDAVQLGTWLSNPTLALTTVPFFFWFLHRVFWEKRAHELPLVALFLGLTNQAAIYTIFLFSAGVCTLWYFWGQGKLPRFTLRSIGLAIVTYGVVTSTMLLNQILLFKNGIFNPFTVAGTVGKTATAPHEMIEIIVRLYEANLQWTLLPSKPLFALLILGIVLAWNWKKLTQAQHVFFLVCFTAPLWLLSVQARTTYHTLAGLGPLLYVFIAVLVHQIKQAQSRWLFMAVFSTLFILLNIQAMHGVRKSHQHIGVIQLGTVRHQLALIDKTYKETAGEPFTISVFGLPYQYNTNWAYLYSWYGQQEYGYVPTFVGSNQAGIPGEFRMTAASEPANTHFSIYEPEQGLPMHLRGDFYREQDFIGPVTDEDEFGPVKLQTRTKTAPESLERRELDQ